MKDTITQEYTSQNEAQDIILKWEKPDDGSEGYEQLTPPVDCYVGTARITSFFREITDDLCRNQYDLWVETVDYIEGFKLDPIYRNLYASQCDSRVKDIIERFRV